MLESQTSTMTGRLLHEHGVNMGWLLAFFGPWFAHLYVEDNDSYPVEAMKKW